jgi:hypothetical protein
MGKRTLKPIRILVSLILLILMFIPLLPEASAAPSLTCSYSDFTGISFKGTGFQGYEPVYIYFDAHWGGSFTADSDGAVGPAGGGKFATGAHSMHLQGQVSGQTNTCNFSVGPKITFYTSTRTGSITVNGITYSNGQSGYWDAATYSLSANPPRGATFSSWTLGPYVTMENSTSNPTTIIVTTSLSVSGSLTANFVLSPT